VYADVYNNGRLDILMSTNGGPVSLFKNELGAANHSLRVKLIGRSPKSRWILGRWCSRDDAKAYRRRCCGAVELFVSERTGADVGVGQQNKVDS